MINGDFGRPSCSSAFGGASSSTATPSASSTFTGWTGGGCSGTGTCHVTLNANTNVTATFTENPHPTLTVAKAGTGSGTVTSNPAGIECGATCSSAFSSGTAITLTAAASAGSSFTGWTGGGCSGTGTCQVTLNADTTATATFTADATAQGGGTPTGPVGPVGPAVTPPTLATLTAARASPSRGAPRARAASSCWPYGTDGPTSLTVTLRRLPASGKKSIRSWTLDRPAAGPFTASLPLPATLLPGRYSVDVTGTSPGGAIAPASRSLALTGPPLGILKDGWISAVRRGPPAPRLPGARTRLSSTFVFAALPTRGAITVVWILPNGLKTSPVIRQRRPLVEATIFSDGSLPRGRYQSVLLVGGKEVARRSVTLVP